MPQWINDDGSVTPLFKSRRYNDAFPYHSGMSIGLATAPSIEGPYAVAVDELIFGPDRMGEIEDPYLWRDAAGYHMVAKDMNASLAGQHHQMAERFLQTRCCTIVLDLEPTSNPRRNAA